MALLMASSRMAVKFSSSPMLGMDCLLQRGSWGFLSRLTHFPFFEKEICPHSEGVMSPSLLDAVVKINGVGLLTCSFTLLGGSGFLSSVCITWEIGRADFVRANFVKVLGPATGPIVSFAGLTLLQSKDPVVTDCT
jgi:hypothetical protein